jgi:hypothetical protein
VPTSPSLIRLSKSFLDHATTLGLVFRICMLPAYSAYAYNICVAGNKKKEEESTKEMKRVKYSIHICVYCVIIK